ncbi:MAG: hypothetical protein AAFW73_23610 [Bacteroidota bacterium]
MPKLVNFRFRPKRSPLFPPSVRRQRLSSGAKWCLLLAGCLLLAPAIRAQFWTEATAISSPAKESVGDWVIDAAGNRYLGGSFGDRLEIGDNLLQSQGKDDVFLAKYRPNGSVDWVVEGGSVDFDQVSALAIDPAGDIVWGGQFWIEGQFGELTLPLGVDSRGIYLLKHSPTGELQWGRSIEGEGLKILSDIQTDAEGNLYLTGYFANTLTFADTTFQAVGLQNLFLLKFDPQGTLVWGSTAGYAGEIRPEVLALSPTGQITVAGDFQGRAVFANDSIKTNTQDRDVFVAAFDPSGRALWGRKAGGVYQDNCLALAVDPSGNAYVTGRYLGVMTLSDSLDIRTEGFNENFYLIAYRPNGTPYQAHSFGGGGDELAHDLLVHDGRLYFTGHYYGDLTIDNRQLPGFTDRFSAFVAVFDTLGQLDWMRRATSDQYVEGNRLVVDGEGTVWVTGHFGDDAQLDEQRISGDGLNDLFIARLDPLLTSTVVAPGAERGVQLNVFPNPVTDEVHLVWKGQRDGTVDLQLFDTRGRLWRRLALEAGQRSWAGNVQHLPAGLYYWQYRVSGGHPAVVPMVIAR